MSVRGLLFLSAVAAGAYVAVSHREELLEIARDLSDEVVGLGLRLTSQFGSELTGEGVEEQGLWRERRLRDVRVRGGGGRGR